MISWYQDFSNSLERQKNHGVRNESQCHLVLVLKGLGLGLSIGLKKVSIAVSKILLSEKVSNSKQSLGLSPDEYIDSSLSEYVCVVVRSV